MGRSMAQHKSAKKRIVRNEKRRVINHARISRIRTFVKKVESAIAAGDKDLAAQALKIAQPELHRGVSKGVLVKNTAARKISRLSKNIKALSA
jgi:small subunit ribosomal protein S20